MSSAVPAEVEKYLIDPSRGWPDGASLPSLAFVDMASCDSHRCLETMPPYPVIGLGSATHPLAAVVDLVLENRVSAAGLIQQIEHAPHAAAVTVQLLRTSHDLPIERALMLESLSYGLLQGSGEFERWLTARGQAPQRAPGWVHVTRRDSVLHVVLDRPRARNAIDRGMRDQLFEAFSLAGLDTEIHSVRLRAIGSAFSAGGDLGEFGTTLDPAAAHLIRCRTLPAIALARPAAILDVHVQGACVGAGLEIAAFAGRVTAATDAWFQLPELAMGLLPGAGGCVSLPRRIGRQRAALMMLSGQQVDAATALQWGLIDAIEDQLPVDESGAHVV